MGARVVIAVAALLLVLAACADSTGTSAALDTSLPPETPATTGAPATTPATAPDTSLPTPLTTTTLAPTTTTTAGTTTTTITTTSVPEAPVTAGPTFPAARSRSAVPWTEVGPGWHLALYDGTLIDESTVVEAPTVLYLVDAAGALYEIEAWDGFPMPFLIVDWRADGTEALIRVGRGPEGRDQVRTLDLTDGSTELLFEITMAEADSFGSLAGYTRPTGANLVLARNDGTTERIERRSPGGALLATLWDQPATPGPQGLTWLYGFDGTTVVIGHGGGMALVSNDGTRIRDLWVPQGRICDPVRWWTATQFLAACRGIGPAFPHDYYSQLWLLRVDGTAGTALEQIPPGEIPVVDFGHADAWSSDAGARLQWWGDCGAAAVRSLAGDGSAVPMAAGFVAQGYELIDVVGDDMAILSWDDCGGAGGELLTTDLDLGGPQVLIPRLAGVVGVGDVAGLAEVYP